MELQLHARNETNETTAPSRNGTGRVSSREPALPANGVNGAGSAVTHILVATRLVEADREAVTLALRMAATHRARVTLLHVLTPFHPISVHWLDAIDNLHRAVSGQSPNEVTAAHEGRSKITEFLQREIPSDLRDSLEIRTECRVGDVATEIARVTDQEAVDLVFLCDRPSRWRPSILSSLTQRIVELNSRPIVFARSQANRNGNGA